MIDRLTWLHISDFHFTATGDPFSQTVACNALLTDLDALGAERGPISFVLVTGDIAFSGRSDEYARASEFLTDLSHHLSVDRSRFFFVPGNHDVDRSLHEFARVGALSVLTSQQEVDRALGNPARIADLIDRQAAYREFVAGFAPNQERVDTRDRLAYVVKFEVGPVKLAVVGLNSAWLCGSDGEATSLVIGEHQILGALEISRDTDPHLVIALTHHPIEWLTAWEQQSCRTSLLTAAHFLHRGHMHETDVTTSPHRRCVVVAAGSAHAGRFYPNSYNVISLDLGAGLSTVYPRTYRPEKRAFEAETPIQAPCLLGGSIPGTPQDLVDAIVTATPVVQEFAVYMSALLLGQKDEIPLRIGDRVEFLPSRMATESDPLQAAAAVAFLGLRNLLRLHDPALPVSARLAAHAPLLEAFGARLKQCADADSTCRTRITNASLIAPQSDLSPPTALPHTATLLQELRAHQDWPLLASQARRSTGSADGRLARLARAALAEALMHSDEGQDRREAAELADELVADSDATVDDYLISCGASEVSGAPARSIQRVIEALSRWPESTSLISYARGLVTRTGDVSLRSALDSARSRTSDQ